MHGPVTCISQDLDRTLIITCCKHLWQKSARFFVDAEGKVLCLHTVMLLAPAKSKMLGQQQPNRLGT